MGRDAFGGFLRVRGEIFERSGTLQDVLRLHAWTFEPRDVAAAQRRREIWPVLCAYLNREGVLRSRAAGLAWVRALEERVDRVRITALAWHPPVLVNDAEEAADFLHLVVAPQCAVLPVRPAPPGIVPWGPPAGPPLPLGVWLDPRAKDLPPGLIDAMLLVLRELADAFLRDLAALPLQVPPSPGRPPTKVPARTPRDPGGGPPGVVPEGWEESGVGGTEGVALQVGPGSSGTGSTVALPGPAVIERVSIYSEDTFAGRVQAKVGAPAASYAAGAGARDVFGDALFLSGASAGALQTEIQWDPFNVFAEWWPRRLVRLGGWRFVFSAANTAGVLAWIAASVDYRLMERVA